MKKNKWTEYKEKIGEKALIDAYWLGLKTLADEVPSKKTIKKYLFDNTDEKIVMEDLVQRRKIWWMTQGSIIDTVENSLDEAFGNGNFDEEIAEFQDSKRGKKIKKSVIYASK